ncbi:LOW QUALITY PROTEIN: uncharacterized protein FYW47_004125 [Aplochiton taeniatus]
MAETVRSLFDYREPPTLDSDGDGIKPVPPPRGRGCGRKRKGTPVKVTQNEDEGGPEHSFTSGDRKEVAESKQPTMDGPFYSPDPAHSSGPAEQAEGGSNGAKTVSGSGSGPSAPASAAVHTPGAAAPALAPAGSLPPNCRIREVHCGSQVRLVVIAIRDITKGEEITVDYSLTEWGDNTIGFRGTVSPGRYECNSEPENINSIKKEEEPVSLSAPSWSLSPSSSPVSHSDASDSDPQNHEDGAPGSTQRRRKKRRSTPSKKRTPHRTPPGRPPLASLAPQQHRTQASPPPTPSSSFPKPLFKAPAPLGSHPPPANLSLSISRGVVLDAMGATQRQTCDFCGRHFRSLGRHLDKHHAHQPDVCATLVERYTQMPQLHVQHSAQAHLSSQQQQQPPTNSQQPPGGAQDLSMTPPPLTAADQSPSSVGRNATPPVLTPPRGRSAVPVSVLKRSPPPIAVSDHQNEEEEEEEEDDEEEEEEEEENGVMEVEDDSGAEDKEKDLLSSSGRLHMLPLLSSLSSLVLYLRRLQHSAFLSLSRQLQSAEAWRLLCHSSLALLILYNRRRECEVSKLAIAEYRVRVTPQCPVPVPPGAPPALTPLEASLSPFERLVLPHLPRVGVQGKRGRVQPLILPPHCEPCLELLLQTRHDVGVDPVNPYVFARPYHSPATPLRGTDLLRSLARSSGTRNPRALTQTRVRRQVAILTQLLLLGEGEEPGQPGGSAVERLEHFLEREYHVTQSCGGIGQDPGLMGRVGRVVLCGERDGVLFRGMSLHHICLELDVMSGNSADSCSEGESDGEPGPGAGQGAQAQAQGPSQAKTQGKEKAVNPTPTVLFIRKGKANSRMPRIKKLKNSPSSASPLSPSHAGRRRPSGQPRTGKRGVLKRPWSEAERAAVEEHLTRNIAELRVPAKADCERCLQLCPLLVSNHRDWRAIKFYCHNRIQLLKKNQRRDTEPTPLVVC